MNFSTSELNLKLKAIKVLTKGCEDGTLIDSQTWCDLLNLKECIRRKLIDMSVAEKSDKNHLGRHI